MIKMTGIKFSERSMPRFYKDPGFNLERGDFCVCPDEKRDKEEKVGYVSGVEYRATDKNFNGEISAVLRKASEEEIYQWNKLKERERRAIAICREKAEKHELMIKISDVYFDDSNNKVVFHFTADKRVDFRELVRDLAQTLHSRIELWQIGVRDEARKIDGLGVCGRRLCCASFLKDFQPVTIKLAKNQDIFLSPGKLSGCCGRLMCCLAYEESQYREMARQAPSLGSRVRADKVAGVVIERNIISQNCVVQDENGNKYTVPFSRIEQFAKKSDNENQLSRKENNESTENKETRKSTDKKQDDAT